MNSCYYLQSCHFIPQSDCLAVNSTVLVCEAPAVPAGTTTISYTLRLDSAPSPNTTSSSALALEVVPDPVVTDFNPKIIPRSTLEVSSNILLTIKVRKNLYCLKFLSYFHNLYSKHSSYLKKGYILST